MPRDTYLRKVLGDDAYTRVKNSRVLMVGAGGIGCELLKNLIASGYSYIAVVDLDTITLSNLNRQFLFRKSDIDESKALTVAKAVQKFNYSGAEIVPYNGNIMDSVQFPIEWWALFDQVFNALDNLEARRYVNRMVHFTRTPLMESGTAGFDGQVQPIYPYASECFDCLPKETPKIFPVCTIRLTPSMPVHCITWAKEFMFQQLFDVQEELPMGDKAAIAGETDDDAERASLAAETNELLHLRPYFRTHLAVESVSMLVQKLFVDDIERLLLIDSLWKTRTKPVSLDWGLLKPKLMELIKEHGSDWPCVDTEIWLPLQNLYVLYRGCAGLSERLSTGDVEFVSFDKDDAYTLDVVSAAANLRLMIFGIETKSQFEIKQIAGNIIPAIATTNAIIAGFSVLGGLRLFSKPCGQDYAQLAKELNQVYISIRPNKYATSALLIGPNAKCPTTSLVTRGILQLTRQRDQYTLQWLVNQLQERYGYNADAISISTGKSRLIYDMDFTDYADVPLPKVPGFSAGSLLLVQDDDDELEGLELYISTTENGGAPQFPDVSLRPKVIEPGPAVVDVDEDNEDLVECEPPFKRQRIQ